MTPLYHHSLEMDELETTFKYTGWAIDLLFDGKFRFNSIFTMAPCGKGGVTANAAPNVDVPVFVFTGTVWNTFYLSEFFVIGEGS